MSNDVPLKKLNVEGIPNELFHKFKLTVMKDRTSIKKVVISFMESYSKGGNPGDSVEKKTDNPGDDLRSPEEILADKIIEARKIQEDLKKREKELIGEPIEVHNVEKMDEIQHTKKPEIEVHSVEKMDESRTTKEPKKRPEEAMAAENNRRSENPGRERRKKRWYSWIPYPFGFDDRKKQRRKE